MRRMRAANPHMETVSAPTDGPRDERMSERKWAPLGKVVRDRASLGIGKGGSPSLGSYGDTPLQEGSG